MSDNFNVCRHETERRDYCNECAICVHCKLPLTLEEYQWNLGQYGKLLKEEPTEVPPILFEHPHCLSEVERLTLTSDNLQIAQTTFDKINASRLLSMAVDYQDNLSLSTNKERSEVYTRAAINQLSIEAEFNREATMDSVAKRLRVMETIASTLYAFLRSKKRDIENDFNEKYNNQHEGARAARKANETAAPNTVARVEKAAKSKEEKHIEGLMKATGLGREDIIAQIAEAKIKAEARGKTQPPAEPTTIN